MRGIFEKALEEKLEAITVRDERVYGWRRHYRIVVCVLEDI